MLPSSSALPLSPSIPDGPPGFFEWVGLRTPGTTVMLSPRGVVVATTRLVNRSAQNTKRAGLSTNTIVGERLASMEGLKEPSIVGVRPVPGGDVARRRLKSFEPHWSNVLVGSSEAVPKGGSGRKLLQFLTAPVL